MKRIYKQLILVLVITVVTVSVFLFNKREYQSAKIYVATDLHYLSDSINDHSYSFDLLTSNSDGKAMKYCTEVLDAFKEEVINSDIDVLIISGDLTFNGEKASHLDVANTLKEIQDSGIQVLVISGNHDVNNEYAYKFENDGYFPTETINGNEFEEIYYDFGLKQAESVDEYSLSYLYKVNDDLYIMMLDTNCYGKNYIQEGSFNWIEQQLQNIKKEKADVITVTHQNVFAHNSSLSFGYTLYNGEQLLELLNKYDVKCNLSGHIHLQHIKSEDLTEIVTSSLMVSPIQYGVIEYDGNINYYTQKVDVSQYASNKNVSDKNLLNFDKYALDFFKESNYKKAMNRLADTDLNQQNKYEVANLFALLNSYYFSGVKQDCSELERAIEISKNSGSSLSNYIDLMVEECNYDYTKVFIKK